MANSYFRFKQFTIHQDRCAMKVTTDSCLFGAWLAAQLIQKGIYPAHALDIGTGTGLLSLMLTQQHPLTIDAVEIDEEAAAQAIENCSSSPWKDRINVMATDVKLFAGVKKYDLVFSNPPFYENELTSDNEKKNKAHHHSGLLLEELFPLLKNNLKPGGHFALLLPVKREKDADHLLEKNGLFLLQKTKVRQSVNHDYFRILLLGTEQDTGSFSTDEISILDQQGNYTTAFIELLKTYYLYL